MKIVCPACEAWYEVPEASVGRGRAVRCAACRTVWTATAADAQRAEEAVRAATRREAERRAADEPERARAEPAFAATADSAPARSDDIESPAPVAPPAAPLPDDGWPDDLSPPKTSDDDANGPAAAIDDAPSVVPGSDPVAEDPPPRDWDAEFEAAEARRIARERARPKPKRGFAVPKPSWATVALSLMVVIGVVLAWRVDIVRALPQTGGLFARLGLPVNLRGLAFDAVTVETDVTDNVPVVVVQGVVVNVSKVRIEVPRLRFSLRDASGAEIHTWTALPQKASLTPGESMPFRTRLASPPAESRAILVRFFTRRDR